MSCALIVGDDDPVRGGAFITGVVLATTNDNHHSGAVYVRPKSRLDLVQPRKRAIGNSVSLVRQQADPTTQLNRNPFQ